jgi:hypothetical protein
MRPTRWISVAVLLWSAAASFAQYDAPVAQEEKGKPFTISAQVRQEYDDNIYTSADNQVDSFSTHVLPTFIFNYPMDQTLVSARYTFGMAYYWDRPGEDIDMSHEFVGRIAHTFTSRFDVDVRDRFVYTYEPDLLTPATSRFVDGNYFINDFSAFARFQWVPRFGNTLEYMNRVVDYDSSYPSTFEDRMEHTINLENRWQVLPTTVAVLGYRFSMVEYDALPKSSVGHFAMVGVDHKISDELVTSARVGAEFRTFDEGDEAASPYVSLNATYSYAPNSSASLFYVHSLSLTDVGAYTTQESDTIGLSLYHAFTPKLGGRISSAVTWGRYDAANTLDNLDNADVSTQLGVSDAVDFDEFSMYVEGALSYSINSYLSTEIGYIFSQLDGDLPYRSYDWNRYYIGIHGTY